MRKKANNHHQNCCENENCQSNINGDKQNHLRDTGIASTLLGVSLPVCSHSLHVHREICELSHNSEKDDQVSEIIIRAFCRIGEITANIYIYNLHCIYLN